MNSRKTVAEFFAGIGLMRLGLERAGWETVWANDNDPDKESIYRHHFSHDEDGHFILDLEELGIEDPSKENQAQYD